MWINLDLLILSIPIFIISSYLILSKKYFQEPPSQYQQNQLLKLVNLSKTEFQPENQNLIDEFQIKYQVEDWQNFGFQRGNSPITDFRGLGLLAPLIMVKSTSIYQNETLGWGLLIINISHSLLQQMQKSSQFLRKFDFVDEDLVLQFTKFVDFEVIRFKKEFSNKGIMEFGVEFQNYQKKYWQ